MYDASSARTTQPARYGETEAEPDYRFTLANERTFLAWIRTAMGLLAGGVAVRQLDDVSRPEVWRALAVACICLAAVLTIGAFVHRRSAQRAIRRGLPLPSTRMIVVVAVGLTTIAVLAAIYALGPR
ncbi:YidH family protein [Nocardia carnea]|uniref:YidH family protein n=1 Tax=Nocardia carnea TaxID=37328 RepID=UPI002455A5D5|nr:DUF202 domain-containing protein [Nocardia carnea]